MVATDEQILEMARQFVDTWVVRPLPMDDGYMRSKYCAEELVALIRAILTPPAPATPSDSESLA